MIKKIIMALAVLAVGIGGFTLYNYTANSLLEVAALIFMVGVAVSPFVVAFSLLFSYFSNRKKKTRVDALTQAEAITPNDNKPAPQGRPKTKRYLLGAWRCVEFVIVVCLFALEARGLYILYNSDSEIVQTLLLSAAGILAGVFVFLYLLLFPRAIESLSNKPNRYKTESSDTVKDYPVSNFGFFTKIAPGQVKIVEQEERFIRCIMRFGGHTFHGMTYEGRDCFHNEAAYWQVIETPEGEKDAHPIPFPEVFFLEKGLIIMFVLFALMPIRLMWYAWKRTVYGVTGYVFTGLYPYRRVRVYKIERHDRHFENDGTEVFEKVEDYSDHFRVADFQFPVIIRESDTLDKLPVRTVVYPVAQINNPYAAAYNTNNWASRFETAITHKVMNFTRRTPLDDVLSASTDEAAGAMSKAILTLNTDVSDRSIDDENLSSFGVKILKAPISDISPVKTENEIQQKLGAVALARVERDAKKELAKGEAAYIREQSKAVRDYGSEGLAVLTAERDVRTAKESGENAIVVVGGGGKTDPLMAAMTHSLKEMNNREKKAKGGGTE